MNDCFLPSSPYLVAMLLHLIIVFSVICPFSLTSLISLSHSLLLCATQSSIVSAIETTYTTTNWSTIPATDNETECSTQQKTFVTALDATIITTPFAPDNTAQYESIA